MAIDKNSKAYQNLLNSGYSDQQITDMYNQASSWQNRQEVVANTKPVNTPTTQSTTPAAQPTEQPTQTTPEVKQETTVKQEENVGSTVPEIKQEWALKPLSQDYYNQTSDDAQSKIISNLNNYRQTNPEYFRDYESFKKNFSYDARNDEQKQTLDSWYGGYQRWMELAGIPVTDLYTQYKDGQVSMNELENLRVYDPTKYAELQAQINKWNIIAAYDDDKWVDTTWMSLQDMAYQYTAQLFQRFMSGDSSSAVSQYFDNYKNNVNSPEMLEIQDKTTDLQEQIENLNDDRARIKKEVEKEYEWTWATRSKINAIIADRSYELDLQLRTLNSEYNKYATQYNNRMQQYQNEFQMQLQEYQLNQDARNQQMQELWFAMDLMNFETNDQRQQREWNYWVKQQEYTNWNINSKDYDTRYKAALKSVQNLLSQYEGIPMQRSAEQMAQDVLKAIDNGSDLGAELTKINKQIQGKPEYKQLYNQAFGKADWVTDTYTIGWQEYVVYNGQIMTADDFNKQHWWTGKMKGYTVVSNDVLKIYSDGRANTYGSFMSNAKHADKNYGGQCGKFVNDYLEEIWVWRYYDNDLSTKLNSVNSDAWKVGTIAVFDYGHKSSDWINHWHVGIVVRWPDKDWNIWVKDSNFGWDEIIQTRKINLRDKSLKWFFDPTLAPDGSKVSVGTDTTTLTSNSNWTTTNATTTITDNDIISFNDKTLNRKLSAADRQRIAEARNKVFSDPNASMEDILRFSQWWDAVTDTTVQGLDKYWQALASLWELQDLLENTNTWPIVWYLRSKNPYDVKAKEIQATIKWLVPTLARWVYSEVWVLTDRDVELYSQIVPNLKSTASVNKAIMAMTLDMLADGYRRKLQTQAALNKDVSGMGWIYNQIIDEANRLKQEIWIDTWTSNTESTPQTRWVWKRLPLWSIDTESTPQTTNFYKQYANTAPWVWKRRPFWNNNQWNIKLSNWQSFNWNS